MQHQTTVETTTNTLVTTDGDDDFDMYFRIATMSRKGRKRKIYTELQRYLHAAEEEEGYKPTNIAVKTYGRVCYPLVLLRSMSFPFLECLQNGRCAFTEQRVSLLTKGVVCGLKSSRQMIVRRIWLSRGACR